MSVLLSVCLFLCVCLLRFLCICLYRGVCLFLCLSAVHASVSVSVLLSLCLCLSDHLSVCMSVSLCPCLSLYVCLSVSVCKPFICLSLFHLNGLSHDFSLCLPFLTLQVFGSRACVWRRTVWLPGEEGEINTQRGTQVLQTDHLRSGFLPQSLHMVSVLLAGPLITAGDLQWLSALWSSLPCIFIFYIIALCIIIILMLSSGRNFILGKEN